MSLNRMPLFCFAILAVSFALIFALPSLTARPASCSSFSASSASTSSTPPHGGDPLLWQHLFWFFGHPEVYIIVLPAFGIATSIIPTFARRRMLAFPLVALAELLVAFIGFGVWAHHMFATGLPRSTLDLLRGGEHDGRDPEDDPGLCLDTHRERPGDRSSARRFSSSAASSSSS